MKHRMKICMRFYRGQGHQLALAPRTPKAPLPPSHLLCLAGDDDQVSTLLSTVTHGFDPGGLISGKIVAGSLECLPGLWAGLTEGFWERGKRSGRLGLVAVLATEWRYQ